MTNDTEIGVYTDLLQPGADCIRVGTLWIHHRRQGSASFEYSQEWLNHPHSYELEPMLPLGRGKYHTAPGQVLFGSMSDSAPDRWGRRLIQQAHRKGLPGYPTVSGALGEQHYLLGVNDMARMGALRYSADGGATFLHTDEGASIPPIIDLLPLHHAAEHLCRDTATPAELRMLLNPGSSLGGAWPKASVKDEQGNLYMAKFSNSQQEYDVVAWEAVAMTIAAKAGIRVPEFCLKRPARGKSVFLSRRFDRSPSGTRLPYISAMTMLQAKDGEVHSYAELAEYMSQYTANPRADLKELWCRIALSIMVTNVDDHPRNHGFLRKERKGWQLAPLFDVNPTPEHVKGHTLSMDIVEGDNTASLKLLCECADIFYIRPRETEELLIPIARAVSGWRSIATNMGIPAAQQEEMSGAFEHAAGYNSVLKP